MRLKFTVFLTLSMAILSVLAISGCDSGSSTGPEDTRRVSITVKVSDDFGRPVSGATLYTNPETTQVVTDEEGKAQLENLSFRTYTLFLKRNGFQTQSTTYTPESTDNQEFSFLIISEVPKAAIFYPANGTYLSKDNTMFSGTGSDPEFGALPESAFIWKSNIDDELGTGPEISPKNMTTGEHTITLTVTDTDGKKTDTSININVSSFNADSYFPVFRNASWDYLHTYPTFNFRNEDDYLENWYLENIFVDIEDNNIRKSSITYKVIIGSKTKEYLYNVYDYLVIEGDDIYIEKTVEEIKIWNGNPYGDPSNELLLTTRYNTDFLIVPSVNDVPEYFSETKTYNMSVTWTYNDQFFGEDEKTENFNRESVLTTGSKTVITANNKQYEAIPLTLSIDGMVRKWYLSKGIGIVSLEYNSFNESLPPVAQMISTNISTQSAKGFVPSKSGTLYTGSRGSYNIDLGDIPAQDTTERLEKLIAVFRQQSAH